MKKLIYPLLIVCSTLGCLGTEKLVEGKGSFLYNMPSREITDTIRVFYHIPADRDRTKIPVIIGFHGNDRDCSYWIETWKEYADI